MIVLNIFLFIATIAIILTIGIVFATAFVSLCEDIYNLIKKQ